MDCATATPAAALLEANKRLLVLRERLGVVVDDRASGVGEIGRNSAADPGILGAVSPPPAHLGWGSAGLTAVLRRQQAAGQPDKPQSRRAAGSGGTAALQGAAGGRDLSRPSPGLLPPAGERHPSGSVKLYPDIGLGMLRQEMTAPGRLWLLLRYCDPEGRGSLRIDIIRNHLTQPTSSLYLCSQRQLRNLLRDGEGVYWRRDKERIWLYSAARVACALGVTGLSGRPVALPAAVLLGGIGDFRAHLYAAFHSSRAKERPGGEQTMPIARQTLAGLSGVGRSSQRAYEQRTGIGVQANFAVGELVTKAAQEERACQKGQALFELEDYRGQHGRPGQHYLAWQLPNSYRGRHQQRPKGRQKRINRQLKDLVMQGMPGNVGGTSETHRPAAGAARPAARVYYPNGRLAAQVYGRDPERELYWPEPGTRHGRFALWHPLGGQGHAG